MQSPRSAFKLQEFPNAVCLRILRGMATPAALSEFGAAINEMIAKSDRARLIVDLSEVDFMPTAMLGHLIAASTKLHIKGGRIRLIGVNEHIAGVFEVTRMKDHFEFHPTVEAALASFGDAA